MAKKAEALLPAQPTTNTTTLGYPCHHCKRTKTKCERVQPCSRCVRLGLCCIPQVRRPPGRPLKLHKTRTQEALERLMDQGVTIVPVQKEGAGSAGPHMAAAHRKQQCTKQSRSALVSTPQKPSGLPAPDESSNSFGHSSSSQQALDTKLVRPVPGVSDMMQLQRAAHSGILAFSRLKTRGLKEVATVVSLLKCWALSCYKSKTDVTLGVYDVIADTLGPHKPGVPVGPHPPDPTAIQRLNPHLEPHLDLLDPSREAEYNDPLPLYIKMLDESSAAVTYHIARNGEFQNFVNEKWASTFMSIEEMEGKLKHFRVLPALMWSCALDPSELPEFYEMCFEYISSAPAPYKELCKVCKCVDRHGIQFLGLVRMRYMALAYARSLAAIMSIVPLPASRYIMSNGCQQSPAGAGWEAIGTKRIKRAAAKEEIGSPSSLESFSPSTERMRGAAAEEENGSLGTVESSSTSTVVVDYYQPILDMPCHDIPNYDTPLSSESGDVLGPFPPWDDLEKGEELVDLLPDLCLLDDGLLA